VAAEVRAKLGHHRIGWRGDCGGHAGHGGGGGVVAPNLVEKETKQIWRRRRIVLGGQRWRRRMVLGCGATDVVRMV
jgi:hypothetical protein